MKVALWTVNALQRGQAMFRAKYLSKAYRNKGMFSSISTKYDNFIKNIPVRSNASTRLNCTPKIKTTKRLIIDVSNHDSQVNDSTYTLIYLYLKQWLWYYFSPESPARACFRCKLFCNFDVFQIISLNYNIRKTLVHLSIFPKNPTSNNVKKNKVLLLVCSWVFVFCIICVNPKNQPSIKTFERYWGGPKTAAQNVWILYEVACFYHEIWLTLTTFNNTWEFFLFSSSFFKQTAE